MQGSMLREFARVFERKVWRVQVANLHNAARALSIPSKCFQPAFWLTSAMRKFKTRFKLVKSWFVLIYSSLAVDGGEIKESCGCEQRFLSSLTEKKEQGTSVSQGISIMIITSDKQLPALLYYFRMQNFHFRKRFEICIFQNQCILVRRYSQVRSPCEIAGLRDSW